MQTDSQCLQERFRGCFEVGMCDSELLKYFQRSKTECFWRMHLQPEWNLPEKNLLADVNWLRITGGYGHSWQDRTDRESRFSVCAQRDDNLREKAVCHKPHAGLKRAHDFPHPIPVHLTPHPRALDKVTPWQSPGSWFPQECPGSQVRPCVQKPGFRRDPGSHGDSDLSSAPVSKGIISEMPEEGVDLCWGQPQGFSIFLWKDSCEKGQHSHTLWYVPAWTNLTSQISVNIS